MDSFIGRTYSAHFAELVPNDDIAANEYNFAVSSYVEQENTKQEIDITVLNQRIQEILTRQQELPTAIDAIVKDLESEG